MRIYADEPYDLFWNREAKAFKEGPVDGHKVTVHSLGYFSFQDLFALPAGDQAAELAMNRRVLEKCVIAVDGNPAGVAPYLQRLTPAGAGKLVEAILQGNVGN